MSRFSIPLEDIRIASPCPADWDAMYGDDRKRFCGDCKLNVYNLSGMTRAEAETLIMNAEGRLCIRMYRRADGTVITSDCPVGWERIKQRTRFYATALASLLMALFTGVLFVSLFSAKDEGRVMGDLIPFATPTPMPLAGAIAVPPKNTNTKTVPPYTMGKPALIEMKGEVATPNEKPSQSGSFETGKMRVLSGERKIG
jgi:hypothetical protein